MKTVHHEDLCKIKQANTKNREKEKDTVTPQSQKMHKQESDEEISYYDTFRSL